MNYSVQIEKSAQKQLTQINSPFFEAISEKIKGLKINPRPVGCKKLVGKESWRIKIGVYRVLYKIQDFNSHVLVVSISHRKHSYR